MAWDGWVSFAGTEVINVARTEAYARNAGAFWFKPHYKNDSLAPILGDGAGYVTPLLDDPDWADPQQPESYDFFGVYPLSIAGIEDSSRQVQITESTTDGGIPGRLRHGSKSIVFNVLLTGLDDAAVEYGFRWLKTALLGGACEDRMSSCSGDEMCFLSSEPVVDLSTGIRSYSVSGPTDEYDGGGPGDDGPDIDGGDPDDPTNPLADGGSPGIFSLIADVGQAGVDVNAEECLALYLRSLRRVSITGGPRVTSKRTTTDGMAVWTAQFTAVAGDPYEYGAEVPVIQGFLDPDVEVPWFGGVEPEGGYTDLDGFVHLDEVCAEQVFEPLFDPLCPALIPPPGPPSIPLGCYTPPANWRRRQITIPAAYVPTWGDMVPMMRFRANEGAVRNMRIRFYTDPQGNGSIEEDPCDYCGDIVVSYIPENSALIFDGVSQTIWVESPGGVRRRADSLVFSTDGTPFEWPVLTCGVGYVVTLDLPQYQAPAYFDLSLYPKVA